jgi:hypothetical protein
MSDAHGLHTAARRFCIAQYAEWVQKYAQLKPTAENYLTPGWTYSEDQCRIFPRYRLAKATLINLERTVPHTNLRLEDMLETTLDAGENAFSSLSSELLRLNSAIALHALDDQRASYSAFLMQIAAQDHIDVDALPFRRVLSEAESEALWEKLKDTWGVRGAGFGWFPLSEDAAPKGALTFHAELWDARNGSEVLKRFLAEAHIERCFLLRELGPPDYEIDTALADAVYDGSESFLFVDDAWVLYVSHESSLTLAGTIADYYRRVWPDADQLSYGGPFHTSDLRGSWSSS